jgi:hypothetical protein
MDDYSSGCVIMNLVERGIVSLTAVIAVVVCLAVAALLGVAQLHPYRPRTGVGWLLCFLAAPLTLGALVLLGQVIDREPFGRWLKTRHGQKRAASVTTGYLVLRTVLMLALLVGTAWCIGSHTPSLQLFLLKHFGN